MNVESVTEVLGQFASSVQLSRLDKAVIERAKLSLLDTLGVAMAGLLSEESKYLLAAIKALHSSGPATIWGTTEVSGISGAALANGTLAHILEADDFGGCGHPGAVVIPAALAASEYCGGDGATLLSAIIAGYEVGGRMTNVLGGYREHNEAGWHSTGTCGGFGAAAAAARILGLNAENTTCALGLAGSYTGGVWAFIKDGSMSKRFHAGKAAQSGVESAYLAQRGFTGPKWVVEAEWGGLLNTYMPGTEVNLEDALADLGKDYIIHRTGIKPYPNCRGVHSPLEAFLELRKCYNLTPDNVDRVRVVGTQLTVRQVGGKNIDNLLGAQMSAPYAISVALIDGTLSPRHYTPSWMDNQAVRDVMERVSVDLDPMAVGEPYVEVIMVNGEIHRYRVEEARGATRSPLSKEEVQDKFRAMASAVLSTCSVESIISTVEDLESLGDIQQLTQWLKPESVLNSAQTGRV